LRAWARRSRARVARSLRSFKAEIVELCRRGDRSVGEGARDFDLTETAVREWVKQAERDAGTRVDGGLTTAEREELNELRREARRLRRGDPQAGHGFAKENPVNIYPFIEAEKAGDHNVKRACELLEVSRCWRSPVPPTTPSAPTSPLPGSGRTPS
jgi:transposase